MNTSRLAPFLFKQLRILLVIVTIVSLGKKSGMTRTDGHSKNEEIEINKGYGYLTN